jgi:hypothetical protein
MSSRHYHISPVTYRPYHNHTIVPQVTPQSYHCPKDTTTIPVLAYRPVHNPSSPADTIISPMPSYGLQYCLTDPTTTPTLSYMHDYKPDTVPTNRPQLQYCPSQPTTIPTLSYKSHHNSNTVPQAT